MKLKLSVLSLCVVLCSGCVLFWSSYSHPAFYFSFKYPKTWSIEGNSTFQTQLNIIMRRSNERFQPNINFVIQKKSKLNLEQISYLSNKQLTKLLNNYINTSQTELNISGFKAIELRGQYSAVNDARIIRSTIFQTDDLDYTVTFTCTPEQEKVYLKNYLKFIKSLKVPKSVANALQ